VNKLFLVEVVLPNLFLVVSRELVEKSESLFLLLEEPLLLLLEFLLLLKLLMLLGLLRVLGLNLVANLGLAVVVVVFACDLTVFLNLVLVLVLGAEVALLSNLDAARERDLGLDIRVVCSGTSEGACLLNAV